MKIIIALDFLAGNDAIGNHIRKLNSYLKDAGYECCVYANTDTDDPNISFIDKERFAELIADESNLLIYSHSIFWGYASEFLKQAKCRVMIKYHNITPEKFFQPYDEHLYKYCRDGRRQTDLLVDIRKDALWVPDSGYNASEVNSDNVVVCAPFNDIGNHDKPDQSLVDSLRSSGVLNLLFVGRVAPNKGHKFLIEIMRTYKQYYASPVHLWIIGKHNNHKYHEELLSAVSGYGLNDCITIVGEVTSSELAAYYRGCDLFLCGSEHEGFCVPLIEAQYHGIPVIARDTSAIRETLGADQVVLGENLLDYAAAVNVIGHDKSMRAFLADAGKRNYEARFTNEAIYKRFMSIVSGRYESVPAFPVRYRFEGPFDSSYSLAIVNREIALAMEKRYPGRVALHSADGPGAYEPSESVFREHPKLKDMWLLSKRENPVWVCARNMYPPASDGMTGHINMLSSYGWEESEFPKEYVREFNRNLSGVTVVSEYVKRVLVNNGVSVPVGVISNGVDHLYNKYADAEPLKLTDKSFSFLYISSCFPRKGADVLLKAYFNVFSGHDDVSLIIKTFPNPHNDVPELLEGLRKAHSCPPEVVYISEDWEDEKIAGLYKSADVFAAPTRGEGFGLPMAEAMLYGLPVITTGYGGQSDFCTSETSWLIDYSFSEAKTHIGQLNSFWAEPDIKCLESMLAEFPKLSEAAVRRKTEKARQFILENFTWDAAAGRLDNFAKRCAGFIPPDIKVGWVSTWNTKCGIAGYSQMLVEHLKKYFSEIRIFADKTGVYIDERLEQGIERCWDADLRSSLDGLRRSVEEFSPQALVIQYNFGFFSLSELASLIDYAKLRGVAVFVFFHSVKDADINGATVSLRSIAGSLSSADRIFVHSLKDINYLKGMGLVENVAFFPHGIKLSPAPAAEVNMLRAEKGLTDKYVIGSYGFMLPHKGIYELIESLDILINKDKINAHLLLVNALYAHGISDEYYDKCRALVNELSLGEHVTFITDYLEDEKSHRLLSMSDIIVFPYLNTQESSSASVRFGLSTGRPVLCTDLEIFADVDGCVHFADGGDCVSLASSVKYIYLNTPDKNIIRCQNSFIEHMTWANAADRLQGTVKGTVYSDNMMF